MTIKEIAELAGVSYSTVSKALNDTGRISDDTRKRIKKIAEERDFAINSSASSLKSKKTGRIGILFSNDDLTNLAKTWIASVHLEALTKQIDGKNYEMQVSTVTGRDGASNLKAMVRKGQVDGFVVVTRDIREEDVALAVKRNIPVVFFGYYPKWVEQSNLSYFAEDNVADGRMIGEYLIKNAGKKLLSITSNNPVYTDYLERSEGFMLAASEHGASGTIITCDTADVTTIFDSISVEDIVKYDAVYCQWDGLAFALISRLVTCGYRIPDDISVFGHDDNYLIRCFEPRLSSLKASRDQLAEKAVERLLEQIERGANACIRYKEHGTIIERETVKNRNG